METLSGETVVHKSDIISSFDLVHRSGTMFALLQSIEILHPTQVKTSNPPPCGKPFASNALLLEYRKWSDASGMSREKGEGNVEGLH